MLLMGIRSHSSLILQFCWTLGPPESRPGAATSAQQVFPPLGLCQESFMIMAGGAVGPGRPVGLGPIEQDLTRPTVRTGSGFGLARGPLPILYLCLHPW